MVTKVHFEQVEEKYPQKLNKMITQKPLSGVTQSVTTLNSHPTVVSPHNNVINSEETVQLQTVIARTPSPSNSSSSLLKAMDKTNNTDLSKIINPDRNSVEEQEYANTIRQYAKKIYHQFYLQKQK
ncbi:unnamed protein product [Didymodactylos carnosus]|uniref:Uncharacterized protein n=1 Tax=Didymodactylos carnosus TaxID=1234261 RepID=A0A815N8M0_9BILA|nr:unnamed protein product [Didymodactylos carnosus]CAF1434118.1 unnamed protein product [Didymodactylos carnosus]CAF3701975.1 unnamed protein product [Didymodactylos carnosus]CAF4312024.1 unnamed protein product [Didymodactylos carnosus]